MIQHRTHVRTWCDSSSAVSSTSAANSVMELRSVPATLPNLLHIFCARSVMATQLRHRRRRCSGIALRN